MARRRAPAGRGGAEPAGCRSDRTPRPGWNVLCYTRIRISGRLLEAAITESKRPSWDEYFLTITQYCSQRSTCLRRHIGAVIVRDKRILATGYNGAPSGLAHCDEVGCLREARNISSGESHELCRGLHAEQNAILQAALYGVGIDGATVYTTHQPCVLCAKMLINAGITRIVYRDSYPDELAQEMLTEACVQLEQITEEALQ